MEVAVSAITGELVSRFIGLLMNKYRSRACLKDMLQRLEDLLLRVHTVVEEAEARYITNSRMLVQLRMLMEAMYRGYHVLDAFKYRPLEEDVREEVSSSYVLSFSSRLKRCRTIRCTIGNRELQCVLEDLETMVGNMAEFVIILGRCERMSRSPYDTYLYVDNFMFGRLVEKHQLINILVKNSPLGAPTVVPIIGGCRVGKKTLVGHVCNDTRVRSYFSSILHLNGDNIQRIDCEKFLSVRTLVVIEFVSDVDDDDWIKFYSSATRMGRGSKVVIISRVYMLARFGTVKPIYVNKMPYEELSYLFKVLAFGSTNLEDHPRLASIGKEFAELLEGSIISANVIADMLRKNMNVQFWLRALKRFKNVVENNFSIFGEHPKLLFDKDHPVDITKFATSSSAAPLHLMPLRIRSDVCKMELPKVTFGDIIVGSTTVLPKEKFEIILWESRIPPYTKYFAICDEEKPQSPRRKRRV